MAPKPFLVAKVNSPKRGGLDAKVQLGARISVRQRLMILELQIKRESEGWHRPTIEQITAEALDMLFSSEQIHKSLDEKKSKA